MKREFTYSFDREDANPLSADYLDNIFSLLQGFATEEEKCEARLHPGLKALRHVKGNRFTVEHLEAFSAFIFELGRRAEDRVRELEQERDQLTANDPHSRKAYDGMIDGIGSSLSLALRDMKSFLSEFCEQVEDAIPGRAFAV